MAQQLAKESDFLEMSCLAIRQRVALEIELHLVSPATESGQVEGVILYRDDLYSEDLVPRLLEARADTADRFPGLHRDWECCHDAL